MAVSKSTRCPFCNCQYCPVRTTNHKDVEVLDKRTGKKVKRTITTRERVCQNCKNPFPTYEIAAGPDDPSKPEESQLDALGPQVLRPQPPKLKMPEQPPVGKKTLKPRDESERPPPPPPYNPFLR